MFSYCPEFVYTIFMIFAYELIFTALIVSLCLCYLETIKLTYLLTYLRTYLLTNTM